MAMDPNPLKIAARAKSEPQYLATYPQLKEHFKESYKAREWIGAMAQAISGSDDKSSKEYKAARRSIERHETGQLKSFAPVRVDKMMAAGMKLPPQGYKPVGDSVTVTVTGMQGNRERSWTATFRGPEAYDFVNNPTYSKFFTLLGYPRDVTETFEGDDSGGVVITSVS